MPLTVGIPKEIKSNERRVGMTPDGVCKLHAHGIPVLVERTAGVLSGFQDHEYEESGAKMVENAVELYAQADLIKKVKEPLPSEWPLLRTGQIIFSFLHLASQEHFDLVTFLRAAGVTAIGYETIEVYGRVPILAPMSEIAGALSSAYAGYLRTFDLSQSRILQNPQEMVKSLQEIASHYPEPPMKYRLGQVVIFGAGTAGQKAMEFALRMGAQVAIVDNEIRKRFFVTVNWQSLYPSLKVLATQDPLEELLAESKVLIGCVHRPGYRAAKVVDDATLARISEKRKKIIMDVAIDQGGNFPESHATLYDDPVYFDSCGNMRFAVANIPSFCGSYASEAITKTTLDYTLAMAVDYDKALVLFPELLDAINVRGGAVVHPAVIRAHQEWNKNV